MKYFVKHPSEEKWLTLYPHIVTQEYLNELVEYTKIKPKFQSTIDEFIHIITPLKIDLVELKKDTENYYYYPQTNFDYVYKFNTHFYKGQKSGSGAYELDELKNYLLNQPKMQELAKVLKTIKLKPEQYEKYPHMNYFSHLFSNRAKMEDLPNSASFEFQEDKSECEFFDDETYVLLYDTGYLNADGYPSAQLSNARLFSNFDSAKRSIAKRSGNIAIMKVSMQCKEVMYGENQASSKIKSYAEKQRIENFLASTTPDELTLLKEKIAEYEKQLNINSANSLQEKPKKKVKI